jgi:hypothetical protein
MEPLSSYIDLRQPFVKSIPFSVDANLFPIRGLLPNTEDLKLDIDRAADAARWPEEYCLLGVPEELHAADKCKSTSPLVISWNVRTEGRVVAAGSTTQEGRGYFGGRDLGSLRLRPHKPYVLTISSSQPVAALQQYRPRVVIEETSDTETGAAVVGLGYLIALIAGVLGSVQILRWRFPHWGPGFL